MTSYTQKLNAFKPRTTFTIQPSGVAWEEVEKDKKSGLIAWENIKTVRLRFEPTRAEMRRIAMHIHAPYPYQITNIDYRGVYDFKLQEDEFVAFVTAFHKAIPDTSRIQFRQGSTTGGYIFNIAMTLFTLIMLMIAGHLIAAMSGVPSASTYARVFLIIVFIPILWKVLKRNRPRKYDPENLPDEYLVV